MAQHEPKSVNELTTRPTPAPASRFASLRAALEELDTPCWVVDTPDGPVVAAVDSPPRCAGARIAFLPACPPARLGDPSFRRAHGLRFAYAAGSMANGIASEELVEALARDGLLGFFGAAGLPLERIEAAIGRLTASLGALPHGFNLIHSPAEPELEAAVVDCYLRRGVRRVEASAYLDLTLPLVRYRVHGIHRGADGRIVVPNRIVAKASRAEVAAKFFAPPPARFLQALVEAGKLAPDAAELAARVPMAEDLTAEADSGGHTDNRPALVVLPALLELRDRMQAEHRYEQPLRVGAAGGLATPAAVAAAFAMGAAYVMTGSINQSCREAGTSDRVRAMLAAAGPADVMMAPAADMFEMGVKVQVLKRGTMFGLRAARLHELYRTVDRLEAIAPAERETLEKTWFRARFADVWERTCAYFAARDPAPIAAARKDPRKKMALVFRWYLGESSRWANAGEPSRQMDYQIWCGPAMGAFNEWVRSSCLEAPEQRLVSTVALNLLCGAAVLTRAHALRIQGVALAPELARIVPRERRDLERWL
ncbi:MAG: PfaD family polyunsaturated fatty acid/polyketide biosynthesis protein [Planctomycetes bacterium]|nr:PfaD family polyunsaturated fatty acid/polyketide biosynthesis protein [Planctomycetota bacterium]